MSYYCHRCRKPFKTPQRLGIHLEAHNRRDAEEEDGEDEDMQEGSGEEESEASHQGR